ncbi:MAG: glycogen debranching protein, partial [Chloroflexi bacterium]|nr:glycogen debranching protein [Chloroflexota bacterium]
MEALIEEARQRAIDVLGRCATDLGFKASALERGYPHVWARDSAIASLGAGVSGQASMVASIRGSLDTL